MAQPLTPQIPQHVTALLSHLTSRPGVQSTLILSRKDGSIIQRTGLLAQSTGSSPQRANSVPTIDNSTATTTTASDPSASPTVSQELAQTTTAKYASSTNQTQPYKPSQAEALAAHIYAFVSSASALSLSLSNPTSSTGPETSYGTRSSTANGPDEPLNPDARQDDAEGDSREREAEDEVKLLRLRTKRHEIVVVPDRKYLLCVVHDASGAAPSSSGGGTASTR